MALKPIWYSATTVVGSIERGNIALCFRSGQISQLKVPFAELYVESKVELVSWPVLYG